MFPYDSRKFKCTYYFPTFPIISPVFPYHVPIISVLLHPFAFIRMLFFICRQLVPCGFFRQSPRGIWGLARGAAFFIDEIFCHPKNHVVFTMFFIVEY
jgi:hypothetical protein